MIDRDVPRSYVDEKTISRAVELAAGAYNIYNIYYVCRGGTQRRGRNAWGPMPTDWN